MKTLVALSAIAAAGLSGAQLTTPRAKEMKDLDWLNGDWTGTIQYAIPGMGKDPIPSTMRVEDVNRGLHKRMVYTIDMPGPNGTTKYEGTVYMTWSAKDSKFKAWTFENMVAEPRIEAGTFADNKLVMISEPHGGIFISRSTFEKIGEKEMKFSVEMKSGDKWSPAGSGTYRRK